MQTDQTAVTRNPITLQRAGQIAISILHNINFKKGTSIPGLHDQPKWLASKTVEWGCTQYEAMAFFILSTVRSSLMGLTGLAPFIGLDAEGVWRKSLSEEREGEIALRNVQNKASSIPPTQISDILSGILDLDGEKMKAEEMERFIEQFILPCIARAIQIKKPTQ